MRRVTKTNSKTKCLGARVADSLDCKGDPVCGRRFQGVMYVHCFDIGVDVEDAHRHLVECTGICVKAHMCRCQNSWAVARFDARTCWRRACVSELEPAAQEAQTVFGITPNTVWVTPINMTAHAHASLHQLAEPPTGRSRYVVQMCSRQRMSGFPDTQMSLHNRRLNQIGTGSTERKWQSSSSTSHPRTQDSTSRGRKRVFSQRLVTTPACCARCPRQSIGMAGQPRNSFDDCRHTSLKAEPAV